MLSSPIVMVSSVAWLLRGHRPQSQSRCQSTVEIDRISLLIESISHYRCQCSRRRPKPSVVVRRPFRLTHAVNHMWYAWFTYVVVSSQGSLKKYLIYCRRWRYIVPCSKLSASKLTHVSCKSILILVLSYELLKRRKWKRGNRLHTRSFHAIIADLGKGLQYLNLIL